MEGAAILREFPGPVGIQLWGALRDVMLWADPARLGAPQFSAGAERDRATQIHAAEMDDGLRADLLELAVRATAGTSSSNHPLADPCLRVAAWAEAQGRRKPGSRSCEPLPCSEPTTRDWPWRPAG